MLAGIVLALLGAGLAWVLAIGLRRTIRGAHLEADTAPEPRSALAG